MEKIFKAYDQTRQYFISQSEEKRIFCSPAFSQRRDCPITKQFYTEIFDRKCLYIRHDEYIEDKYYFTFNNAFMMSRHVDMLDISINVDEPMEFEVLWSIRVDWLNKSYDRSKFLKKYNYLGPC